MNAVVEQPDDPRYPATPMQMLQLAISQSTDMERLKTLMDLQERWEANQAKKAFNVALAAFKKNPPVVVKDLLNTQYNSMYTSLGNLVNTVNERLGEYGLSASWDIEQSPETIKVTCILEHVDGHSRRVSIESPPDESGSKNDLQKIKSTLTYLRGSTFEAVTGIASRAVNQDDDGNGAGRRPQQEEAPDGYDNWHADMTALAEEGTEKLTDAWSKSSGEFRRYVVKYDEVWWRDCKSKAKKVVTP